MKKRSAVAAALAGVMTLAAGAVAAGTVAAGAEPTRQAFGGAKSAVLGNVRLDPSDPTVAFVTGQYVCPAGESPHLWVSVKQLNSGRPSNALKGEGSGFGGVADAWSQAHPDPSGITCDGTWHTITVRTDETESFVDPESGQTVTVGYGQLKPGQVYVQFCLTPAGDAFTWAGIDMRFAVAI